MAFGTGFLQDQQCRVGSHKHHKDKTDHPQSLIDAMSATTWPRNARWEGRNARALRMQPKTTQQCSILLELTACRVNFIFLQILVMAADVISCQ